MGDIWSGVKTVVQQLAPAIATALGGPLAGMAVQAVSQALLGRPDAPAAEVVAAVANANPEQLAALKAADQTFTVRLTELGIDMAKLNQADRADARAMYRVDAWTPRLLAAGVMVAWLGLNGAVLAFGLPEGAGELLSRALGGLDALQLMVFGFYFGSSAGSQAKTDALAVAARR